MEISRFRHPISYTGDEKYEMLELNRRLESYLNHVQSLEEENQLLWREIQTIRMKQDSGGQRQAQKKELSQARKELQHAWLEKDHVELEVINLMEEIEELNMLRQKEKSAWAEAKRKLEESRKALEDERKMQIWLREKATCLEKEVSLQVQVHQEDVVALKSTCAFAKPVIKAPQHSQTLNLQVLGEEYNQRAAQAWREAEAVYQTDMKKLEDSLAQTRAHMTMVKQEKAESQLQIQNLEKELESTQAKKKMMEMNMVQQNERQNQYLQHLQAHVEVLEANKLDLNEQMGELLVESRNLQQKKMSLSLELANYRALLDSESLRVNNQSTRKGSRADSRLEGTTRSPGILPGTRAMTSRLFSSPLNTTSRSITHKASPMTPLWNLTLRTPHETPRRAQTNKEDESTAKIENQILESPTSLAKKNLTGPGSLDYRVDEKANFTTVSSAKGPKFVDESEYKLGINVTEDIQEDLKAVIGTVLFNTNETEKISSPAGHVQTPESVSSSQNIEETKSSEDGEEEISTEIAQISHAPVSAWEENETVILEEKGVVFKLEPASIVENGTQEFRVESDHPELQEVSENPPKSESLQEILNLSADACSPLEDDSEILTWADVKEDVIHFVEEESLKSASEGQGNLVKENKDREDKMEVEQAEWPVIDELEVHQLDDQVKEEKKEPEQEEKVPQSQEEELTNGGEERMIEEEIEENLLMSTHVKLEGERAVMDEGDKDQLVEHNAEDDQGQSDEDESLNITASWRTDPEEADSYVQEKTLADTRPLIHYSDEEMYAKIPNSYMGASERTNREEASDKPEEASQWSQIIAKRFDTMEDLSEEPELGSMDDIVTDGSIQTMLKENTDEDTVVQHESGDIDSHVRTLTEDDVDEAESNLRINNNENSQCEEETKSENLSTFCVKTEEEISELHDWSASSYTETKEISEQQTLLNTQANITEESLTECIENPENVITETMEDKPVNESEERNYFDMPLPEPCPEAAFAEDPSQEASTDLTHSVMFHLDTAITVEQACPKEEDVQSNLPMPTHVDCTDKFSLHSHPESQTSPKDSDLEEHNSSEDESLNSSQCSQVLAESEMRTQKLDQDNVTVDVDSNTDPEVLLGEVKEGISEVDLEDKKEHQYSVESSRAGGDENTDILHLEWENVAPQSTMASNNILEAEKSGAVEIENQTDQTDKEYEQAKSYQSIFNSSEEEGIWSATQFKTAATYESSTQEFNIDDKHAELQLLVESTKKSATLLLQEIPHLSADACSPVDESEILRLAKDDAVHVVEEESLKSALDLEGTLMKGIEHVEEEQAEWPGIDDLEGHPFGMDVKEGENELEQEQTFLQTIDENLTKGENEGRIEEEIEEHSRELKAEFEQLNTTQSWRTDHGEADSYDQENNSSEDECPDESQYSQLFSQSAKQTRPLDTDSVSMDVVLNPDYGLTSGVQREEISEDFQPEENIEELQHAVDSNISGILFPEEQENVDNKITSASHNILSPSEECGDMTTEKNADMDVFQGAALKENDSHSFSLGISEGIWSAAATYDPNDQAETERYSYGIFNSNQSLAFEDDWSNTQRLPTTNNIPEKDLGTSIAHPNVEEQEERKTAQLKQVHGKDVKDGDDECIHVEDSTDEGDSWSSGEE